jgi:ADP-dependent NAD(P)H-hydrate dehydratase / NAD(P)H-hydrate epimerase
MEMAVMEANAVALGVSVDSLMENAGRALAEECARRTAPAPQRVVVLAGPGNNGGDGTCAAHYLAQWGFHPEVWLVRPPSEIRTPAARRCYERAAAEMRVRVGVPTASQLEGAAIVLDALLGSGQSGELRPPYREAVETANASGVPILSVDVPTGLGAPQAVRPRWTVALTVPKPGMSRENSGEVIVREIGIPREAREETGPGVFLLYPSHPPPDPRGRNARVLIIGGGPYSGAPALTALAALRAGAERATIVAPALAAAALRGFSPDLVVETVGRDRFEPEDLPLLQRAVQRPRLDAVMIGMGAGDSDATRATLQSLLPLVPPALPMLVDADGLRALTEPPVGARRSMVATPNAGEYERVFQGSGSDRATEVAERARRFGATLLVKGPVDVISDGAESFLNRRHHPAASVGGVGDVLSGVVGSLLAQKLRPVDAARLGAYWVGDAGARAAEAGGFGILATDVLQRLPESLVEGTRRVRALR